MTNLALSIATAIANNMHRANDPGEASPEVEATEVDEAQFAITTPMGRFCVTVKEI